MSRKIVYNIDRFDGGITDDIRTSDLSKCAHVSHFDIYCDPHRLVPMPGYIADQDTVSGGADDLQNYNIKAFTYFNQMYAVGTKTDGTGSQMFQKNSPTDAEWTKFTNDGTDDLSDNTFLQYSKDTASLFYVTNASSNTYLSYIPAAPATGTVTDKHATIAPGTTAVQHVTEYAFDDVTYFNTGNADIGKIVGNVVTDPAKSTAIFVTDIQSGNEQIGIVGYRFYPYRSQLLLWDSGSTLVDRKIELGTGRSACLGYPSSTWVVALNETAVDLTTSSLNEEMNGRHTIAIKYISGDTAITLTRLSAVVETNNDLFPIRGKYQDSMLFYAKLANNATPDEYREGIWAVGRCKETSPLAVSLLMETTELGSMEGFFQIGNHAFFAHGGDGSVSRLDNYRTGTYDVDCEYQSLMLGSNTPFMKQLNGISVSTEDLPSGGSVAVSYRFDEDDAWTALGTSSTTGDEVHNFTTAAGTEIGNFREIQFKVVVSGKVAIKNIVVSITETDDLPYNL